MQFAQHSSTVRNKAVTALGVLALACAPLFLTPEYTLAFGIFHVLSLLSLGKEDTSEKQQHSPSETEMAFVPVKKMGTISTLTFKERFPTFWVIPSSPLL